MATDPTRPMEPQSPAVSPVESREEPDEAAVSKPWRQHVATGFAPPPVWAVVVIHGVGETNPGQTLDALVPALIANSGGNLVEAALPETRMLFAEKDNPTPPIPDYPIPPLKSNDPPNGAPYKDRFPMSLRRVSVGSPRTGTPKEAVFAEVYWADLSVAPGGMLNLLKQVFTIIFHLRFVADQGAELNNRWARWFRSCLCLTSWILCGPIAALNALVLYMVVAHLFVRKLVGGTDFLCKHFVNDVGFHLTPDQMRTSLELFSILGAAVAGSVAYRASSRDWSSPWKLVFNCASFFSAAVALATLWEVDGYLSSFKDGRAVLKWANDDPYDIYVFLLFLAIRIVFAILCLLVLAALAIWCVALWATRRRPAYRRSLLGSFGTLLLQIAIWVILVPTIAVYAFHLLDTRLLESRDSPLAPVKQAFILHLIHAVVIAAMIAILVILRRVWAELYRHWWVTDEKTIPRLIVNWLLLWALIVFSIGGVSINLADSFIKTMHFFDWGTEYRPYIETLFSSPVLSTLFDWLNLNLTAIVLAVVALVGYFSEFARAIGHILMDIVSHFYREKFDIPNPQGPMSHLAIGDFVVQQRIEARLRRVLQEMVEWGDVTDLTVVSHSQGTVIAVDVLWYPWTARLLDNVNVRLVTMGSPFTHLYQYYFPSRYPRLFTKRGRAFNRRGWGDLYSTIGTWTNVFRVDDFVGTYIDGATKNGRAWPENWPVAEKGYHGHIGYWAQPGVLALIREQLPG